LNESFENDQLESTKEPSPLELTDRDIAAFKLIHEHRYLVYNQIHRAFWKGRSVPAKACYKRVEKLVKFGYLKQGYSKRKSIHIYFVTDKSLKVLTERGLDSTLPLYVPGPNLEHHIAHDLNVTNLRTLFRELGLDAWRSERILRERDHLQRVPDGVLNIRGKKAAIEFENHLTKSKIRYQQLFDYYRAHDKEHYLLFVIIDGDTRDWLLTLNYDARQVWVTTYSELMNKREEALFENKRASFKLSRLL
jgi:hypothetical protein